jgi:cysteine desulfurase
LIYLDWAASAPLAKEARSALLASLDEPRGNPSSLHAQGRAARSSLEASRAALAAALGVEPRGISLCSGATEANNIAVFQLLSRPSKGSVLVSPLEHPSVWEALRSLGRQGWRVKECRPTADGRIDPSAFAAACEQDTALAFLMAVNNETGAVQPVPELREALERLAASGRRKPLLHVDMAQSFGKLPSAPFVEAADSISVSGHKLGSPRGVGALWSRGRLQALYAGGGQEGGVRPGTEADALAASFAACVAGDGEVEARLRQGREICSILLDGVAALGGHALPRARTRADDPRYSPWIIAACFPGLPGEALQRALDAIGLSVGTGSACSAARRNGRVMESMGIGVDEAASSIRLSFGHGFTLDMAEEALELLKAGIKRLKGL